MPLLSSFFAENPTPASPVPPVQRLHSWREILHLWSYKCHGSSFVVLMAAIRTHFARARRCHGSVCYLRSGVWELEVSKWRRDHLDLTICTTANSLLEPGVILHIILISYFSKAYYWQHFGSHGFGGCYIVPSDHVHLLVLELWNFMCHSYSEDEQRREAQFRRELSWASGGISHETPKGGDYTQSFENV